MTPTPLTATPTQSEICGLRAEFARRLKARMKTYNLDKKAVEHRSSQLVLAGEVKRAVNRTNLYPLLDGRQLPNKDTLETLAKVLQCQPQDLVPDVGVIQQTRGRRRVVANRAHVSLKRTSLGLESARLQIDVVLPPSVGEGLYRVFREVFKHRGMELDPPENSMDRTPLDRDLKLKVFADLLDPRARTPR